MKKQIVNVSVFQNAKVAAALYFAISIPFVLLMILFAMVTGMGRSMGTITLLLMPVLYALFGFIFTAIFAWVYNIVASIVGGMEFTTSEVSK